MTATAQRAEPARKAGRPAGSKNRPKPIANIDLDALPPQTLLPRRERALILRTAEKTLQVWEREGRGPPVFEMEGRTFCTAATMRAYLASLASAGRRA